MRAFPLDMSKWNTSAVSTLITTLQSGLLLMLQHIHPTLNNIPSASQYSHLI
jgi:hypothetical protein